MFSVVQACEGEHATKCGYCKSKTGSISYGLWAHRLTPSDYQSLIDRGWRRSGMYIYKPSMDKTCCPAFTIRGAATLFSMHRSHKRILKRMQKYMEGDLIGEIRRRRYSSTSSDNRVEISGAWAAKLRVDHPQPPSAPAPLNMDAVTTMPPAPREPKMAVPGADAPTLPTNGMKMPSSGPRSPAAAATELPKKAKQRRLERKIARLKAQGRDVEQALAESRANWRRSNKPLSLEKMIEWRPHQRKYAHKLEVTCVPAAVTDETFALYHKYQVAVHGDKPEKITREGFKRFLVDSPIVREQFPEGTPKVEGIDSYGTFHQLYRLDKKLVAVGVIDILPHCVSSVYLFYDPEYAMLSLGVYSSLREIYLARALSKHLPLLKYQYLGYYIHTCPKMQYKAQYGPAELLCPHSLEFVPFDSCASRVDLSKGVTLKPNGPSQLPVVNPGDTLLLVDGGVRSFKMMSNDEARPIVSLVCEYARRVGTALSAKMLLSP
eukprot:Opistho-2@89390